MDINDLVGGYLEAVELEQSNQDLMDANYLNNNRDTETLDWLDDLAKEYEAKAEQEEKVKAEKKDTGKPRMSLVPQAATREIAKVMTFGAKKYGPHNWKRGFDWSRLLDAALRHLNSFAQKEDLDDETGLSHLAHAGCEVMMLLESVLKGLGTDDRG